MTDFEKGMISEAAKYQSPVLMELDRINDRCNIQRANGQIVKYDASKESIPEPVITLEMKRVFAASGFTTVCVAVMFAAEQGAFAAAATFGGYIVAGAGGLGLAWVILKSCFTLANENVKAHTTTHTNTDTDRQNINVTVNVAGQTVNTNQK